WQACTGQPLTIWRTALHQKRPYLELGEAVHALDFIIKTDRCDNQVYNILTENATVGQIVDLISALVPATRVEYVDSPIMTQLSSEVSCEKFHALGFESSGSLAQGIRETVDLIRGVRQT